MSKYNIRGHTSADYHGAREKETQTRLRTGRPVYRQRLLKLHRNINNIYVYTIRTK